MDINYSVQIEGFAERHFIKNFEKKYKSQWDVTLRSIIFGLERIDNLLKTDKASIILGDDNIKIIKSEFKIAGSKESTKTSGDRCIVAWHKKDGMVFVLLVYGKTDLSSKNKETNEWKNLIKNNYPKYEYLF